MQKKLLSIDLITITVRTDIIIQIYYTFIRTKIQKYKNKNNLQLNKNPRSRKL